VKREAVEKKRERERGRERERERKRWREREREREREGERERDRNTHYYEEPPTKEIRQVQKKKLLSFKKYEPLGGAVHERSPPGQKGVTSPTYFIKRVVIQCVAAKCISVLQCVAVKESQSTDLFHRGSRVVMCCSNVSQCVAVRCSALQCVAVCCSVLQWVAVCCLVW